MISRQSNTMKSPHWGCEPQIGPQCSVPWSGGQPVHNNGVGIARSAGQQFPSCQHRLAPVPESCCVLSGQQGGPVRMSLCVCLPAPLPAPLPALAGTEPLAAVGGAAAHALKGTHAAHRPRPPAHHPRQASPLLAPGLRSRPLDLQFVATLSLTLKIPCTNNQAYTRRYKAGGRTEHR